MNENIKHRASIKDPAFKKSEWSFRSDSTRDPEYSRIPQLQHRLLFFLSNDDGLAAIKILMDGRDCCIVSNYIRRWSTVVFFISVLLFLFLVPRSKTISSMQTVQGWFVLFKICCYICCNCVLWSTFVGLKPN